MSGPPEETSHLLQQLQLRHLQDLVAIVEEGSFTGAALRRRVSQPTLSSSVRQLERALGGQVLERGRPVLPTKLGLIALDHARRVGVVLRSLDAEVTRLSARTPRTIRVGIFAAGAGPLTARVPDIIGMRTGLELSISAVDLNQQSARILDGTLDLVLTYGPFADPRLRVTPLGPQPRVAAVGTRHPLAEARQVHVADVLEYPVPAPISGVPAEWHAWWLLGPERNGIRPREVSLSTSDADPIAQLRQAAIRGLVVLVDQHLREALPGAANGLRYVPVVDAASGVGVLLSRVGAGPLIQSVVSKVEELVAVSTQPIPVRDRPRQPTFPGGSFVGAVRVAPPVSRVAALSPDPSPIRMATSVRERRP